MSETFGTYTRIVGVTHKNTDGTDRQELIATLSPGDSVEFERDYNNEYDDNAILVLNVHGQQLGYIRAALAEALAPIMDEGGRVIGIVTDVTGGGTGESYGCNIRIEAFSTEHIEPYSYDNTLEEPEEDLCEELKEDIEEDDDLEVVSLPASLKIALMLFGAFLVTVILTILIK